MGLLILLSSGAVLGWLVSLLTGAQSSRGAWLRVGLGAATTVVSGMAVSDISLFETLGVHALLIALVAGCAVLALVSIMEPSLRR